MSVPAYAIDDETAIQVTNGYVEVSVLPRRSLGVGVAE